MQYLKAKLGLGVLMYGAWLSPQGFAGSADCDPAKVQPLLLGRNDQSQFTLTVCDGFDGGSLDTNLWSYNFSWGDSSQIIGKTTEFNFNAAFDPAMVTTRDGKLLLTAVNHPVSSAVELHADGTSSPHHMPDNFCQQLKGGFPAACQLDYSTGAVTSRFKFRYGYLEGRFRFPDTNGFWPAFWLLNGGWPPETDIMELLTNQAADGTYHYMLSQTYHYSDAWGQHGASGRSYGNNDLVGLGLCTDAASPSCGAALSQSFHVFGVEWTAEAVNFYVDGHLTHSFTDAARITSQEAYILINLGVGGWADSPNGQTDWSKAQMQVDWVRLWTLPGQAAPLKHRG